MLANSPLLLVLELIPVSSQWHRVDRSVYCHVGQHSTIRAGACFLIMTQILQECMLSSWPTLHYWNWCLFPHSDTEFIGVYVVVLANTPLLELVPVSSQRHRVYRSVYVVMLVNAPLLELVPVSS